jgi:hypothetical protein
MHKAHETDDLVSSWILMHQADDESSMRDKLRWSDIELSRLASDDPRVCLRYIIEICNLSNHPRVLEGLAAGPLEDLLHEHGSALIEDVARIARGDERFRALLGGVWQGEIEEGIWTRLQALRGEPW